MDIVTKKYKLSETGSLPEQLKELIREIVKDSKLDIEKVEYVQKGLEVYKQPDFNDGEKSVITYITTGGMDRDREIIKPDGGDFTTYLKHPVVLFAHRYSDGLPIGRCSWIKSDGLNKGLIAKTIYANTPQADLIYNYRKDGFPLAVSIGFVPTSYVSANDITKKDEFALEIKNAIKNGWVTEKNAGEVRNIIQKWTLLEYSDVAIPANSQALQIAVNKGIISKEEFESEMKTIVQVDGLKKEDNIIAPVIETEIQSQVTNINVMDVKSLVTNVQENKDDIGKIINNTVVPIEDKSTEPPIFNDVKVKVQDNKGNPGMRDIVSSLNKCMSKNMNSMKDLETVESMEYAYVDEIYPINYPDGHAVFCCYGNNNKTKCMDYSYTYDKILNDCVINMDSGVEMSQTYMPKKNLEIISNSKFIEIKDCFGKQYIIDIKQPINEYEESRKTLAINSFPNFKSVEPLGREQWEKLYIDWISYFLNSMPGKETIVEFCKEKNLSYKGISDVEDDGIDEMDFVEMKPAPEETANEIRIRVRDPKDFEKNSFKYKVIKADKPKVAAIFGKLVGKSTMTLQAYRFPKEDGWTLEKAKAWVKEHSKKEFKFEDEFDIKQAAEILKQILDEEKKNTLDLMENFARKLGKVQL